MGQIIAIINQKGGVGKTTTAHTLGSGLGIRGKKILLIDMDGQRSLSQITNIEEGPGDIFDVLTLKKTLAQCIQSKGSFDIVPASERLFKADYEINEIGKEFRLKEQLENLSDQYDYIIIDTTPALGIITINALTAADSIIIPAQPDILSLQSIGDLYKTISAVKSYTNKKLEIMGILITRYNGRINASKYITPMMNDTAEAIGTTVLKPYIRECTTIKEAQINRIDVFTYDKNSNIAKDYNELIDLYFTN